MVLCRHAELGNVEQRERLALELRGVALAAVYTSPLRRATQTARAVAVNLGSEPLIFDDLREIELGDVEGLQFDDYPPELQQALLEAPGSVQFPGGESYAALRERVVAALDEIVARHERELVAVVSHAGAIRAAFAHWLGIAGDAAFRIDQSFANINVVDWIEGEPFVRVVNAATMPPALRAVL